MKILHLIQRFPPGIGGAEFWCEGVAHYFAERGHEVDVLTVRVVDEGDLWRDLKAPERESAVGALDLDGRVRVRRCGLSETPWGLVRLGEELGLNVGGPFSAELFRLALKAARRADIVHIHQCTGAPSFWGLAAARLARRPTVITPHFHPGDPIFEQAAVGWLLRRCDAVIAVTPWEAQLFARRGVEPRRLVVATNAIDLGRYPAVASEGIRERVRALWGLGPDTRIVTFLGRKSPHKNIPVLIEAAAKLGRTTDLALVLVGPRSDWYQAARAGWSARGLRMIDVPTVPETTKLAVLAASDVLVQPSLREAFGIVFLEAWASGIPVVGANFGAVPDVVADGGLTFTPDDPADLAAKIGWLLEHPEEGRAMARRARERAAREHTWERIGSAVEEAYAIALRSRRLPRGAADPAAERAATRMAGGA